MGALLTSANICSVLKATGWNVSKETANKVRVTFPIKWLTEYPPFLKYSTVSTRTCDSIIDMWFWTVSQKQDSVPIQLKEHPIVRHEYTNIVFDMQMAFLSQRHWSHTDYMCCPNQVILNENPAVFSLSVIIRPFEKLQYYAVAMSVRPSVRGLGLFATCMHFKLGIYIQYVACHVKFEFHRNRVLLPHFTAQSKSYTFFAIMAS